MLHIPEYLTLRVIWGLETPALRGSGVAVITLLDLGRGGCSVCSGPRPKGYGGPPQSGLSNSPITREELGMENQGNPEIILAYGACTISGLIIGLLIGWLIWG